MMPHHFRMLLVILAFPFTYFLGFASYQVYLEHWHTASAPLLNKARVQYPNYHLVALDALSAFKALPTSQQNDIRGSLEKNLIDFDDWVADFIIHPPEITCIGENHSDQTREFLSRYLFAAFEPDVLMIESTEDERQAIVRDTRSYVPLLGADIQGIIKAQSQSAAIIGIDQTKEQASLSREQAILQNFQTHAKIGQTHVVLFGALHCGDFEGWFYDLLSHAPTVFSPEQRTNLRVVGEHQDGSLEAFIYFLDEIGITKDHFAIPKTRNLPPWIYKMFPVFNDQTLKHFDTVLVFRSL